MKGRGGRPRVRSAAGARDEKDHRTKAREQATFSGSRGWDPPAEQPAEKTMETGPAAGAYFKERAGNGGRPERGAEKTMKAGGRDRAKDRRDGRAGTRSAAADGPAGKDQGARSSLSGRKARLEARFEKDHESRRRFFAQAGTGPGPAEKGTGRAQKRGLLRSAGLFQGAAGVSGYWNRPTPTAA